MGNQVFYQGTLTTSQNPANKEALGIGLLVVTNSLCHIMCLQTKSLLQEQNKSQCRV